MALETATYIDGLVSTNPVAGDAISAGDDHLRLIKTTVKATFPNVTGAVTPTHTELNYVDGVTSAIQTQMDLKAAQTAVDLKAPLASPTLTGTPAAPTAATGTNTTQIATTAYVTAAQGKWIQLGATQTASATAAIDFINGTGGVVLSATYDEYMVVIHAALPQTDTAELWLRTSTNASTFDATASNYETRYSSGSLLATTTAVVVACNSVGATAVGNAANEHGFFGSVQFFGPSVARYFMAACVGAFVEASATGPAASSSVGRRVAAADVDGLRFMFSTGNITSGTFTLYGRNK